MAPFVWWKIFFEKYFPPFPVFVRHFLIFPAFSLLYTLVLPSPLYTDLVSFSLWLWCLAYLGQTFFTDLLGFSFARSISKFLWWISLGVAVLLLVFSL
ncbi:hypothetical protein V6Z11_D05G365100 [Gossypium hirsutum]